MPSSAQTVAIENTAAIDESNTTVGIADSDLYFASPAQMDAALDEMQAMGVNTVRVGIPWAGINPVPGYYDWSHSDYLINAADARGMGVLAVITTTPGYAQNPASPGVYSAPTNPADFGTFAGLAAQRYAGKVGAYEIWNEPNAAPFYGPQPDPAGYTQLLKAAYPTIKAADPNATVVGGVVGSTVTYGNLTMNPVDFVDGMYKAGAAGSFDALSFHPYQYTTPFSQGEPLPNSPLNQLEDIRALMVANGDAGKTVWASEYGEPTAVASEAQQAAYLKDMLSTWRTLSYTGPAFVYTLQDTDSSSSDPEATFGLIRSDGTWKPAAYIVRDLATNPGTTATMAKMALAMPQAAQADPADLATLTQLAASAPATVPTATTTEATTATAPVMQAPVLQAPVIQAPVLQAPALQASATQAPATQAPTVTAPTAAKTVPTVAVPAPTTAATTAPTTQAPVIQAPVLQTPVLQAPALQSSPTAVPSTQLAPSISVASTPTKTAAPSNTAAASKTATAPKPSAPASKPAAKSGSSNGQSQPKNVKQRRG